MAFVLMSIFEEAPRRFDRWMNILTLGNLQLVQEEITAKMLFYGFPNLRLDISKRTASVASFATKSAPSSAFRQPITIRWFFLSPTFAKVAWPAWCSARQTPLLTR